MHILNKKELKSVIGGSTAIEYGLAGMLGYFINLVGLDAEEITEVWVITKLEVEEGKFEITFENGSEIKIEENSFKVELYDSDGNEYKLVG